MHSTIAGSSKNGRRFGCNNLLHFAIVQLVKLGYTAHIDNEPGVGIMRYNLFLSEIFAALGDVDRAAEITIAYFEEI